jgi:PTS system glucitol/sorbitol-specific IIB component
VAVLLRGRLPAPAAVPRPVLTTSTTLEVPVPGPYKKAKIAAGRGGWGGPLTIEPTEKRPLIYCVTGGGIHPVAQRIADITGGEVFDGFKSSAPFDKIAVAVIDCGGTARVGVYPMKKVPTVDIHATSPAGPLSMFITADLFVSGVKPDNITEA